MVTGAMCTKRKFYLLFLFLNWQLLGRPVGSSLPLESRKGLTRDVIDTCTTHASHVQCCVKDADCKINNNINNNNNNNKKKKNIKEDG